MPLLKHQHRPQPHRPLPRPPNINPHPLRLPQHLIPPRTIPRNERPHPLPPQIQNLPREPLTELLELRVEVLAHARRPGDQIVPLDLIDDGAEEEGPGGIPHPGVELAVGEVGTERRVGEVVTRCLGLLGEGYDVRRGG